MYNQIAANKIKSVVLIFLFIFLILVVGYVYGEATDTGYIGLGVASVFATFSSFFGYYFSDKITLAVSRAHLIKKEDNPTLYRLVENLAITAGVPLPKIYIIDDTAPNAFATGRDPEHAVIAVTTGLLQKLEKIELEGVIAHELSHVKNYDIRVMTVVVVFAGIIALMSDLFLRWTWFGGRGRRGKDGNQLQLIMLVVGIALAIITPIVATLIQLAISRKREYLADASGALLTRFPEGLARALEKISSDREPLEAANKATAHLYIVNPLKGGGFNRLFATHPPIEERIRVLRSMIG